MVALSTDYCDQLNNSQGTGIRHRGEDFISTIQRIKMLRDKRVNEVHKKKQRSEQGTREKADQKEQEREKYKQETFERAQRDRLRQGQQPAQRKADREKSEQHNGASVDSEINYYKILQVDVSAEPEMITAAYWLLVSKYHPAVYKGSDSSLRMRELDQAYQVLSDPEKRRRYDIILGIS